MFKNKKQVIILAAVFLIALVWMIFSLITDYNLDILILLISMIVVVVGGFIFAFINMFGFFKANRYAKSLVNKVQKNPFEELVIKAVDNKLKDIIKQYLKEANIRNISALETVYYQNMVCITYEYKKYNVLFDIKEDKVIYNIYEPEHYYAKLGRNAIFLPLNRDHILELGVSNHKNVNAVMNFLVSEIKKINHEIDAFDEKIDFDYKPECFQVLHQNVVKKSYYWLNVLIAFVIVVVATIIELLAYKKIINSEEVKLLNVFTALIKVISLGVVLEIPLTIESKEIYFKRKKMRIGIMIAITLYSIVHIIGALIAKDSFVNNCVILYYVVLIVYGLLSIPKYLNTVQYGLDYEFLIRKVYDKNYQGKIILKCIDKDTYSIGNELIQYCFKDEQLPKKYLYKVIKNMLRRMAYQNRIKSKFFYYEVSNQYLELVVDGKEIKLVNKGRLNALKYHLTHYKKK